MSLPPQLLNRVNKELKEKTDSLTAELQRTSSMIQLERQVLQVTNQKLVTAQNQFLNVQRLVEDSTKKLQDAEHGLTVDKRETERIKSELLSRQGKSKDVLQKADAAERAAQEARMKYLIADQLSKEQEQGILKWIEENKLTAAATAQANSILAQSETRTKDLQRTTEMLRTQVQQMEEHYDEERRTTEQLRSEINDAIRARQELEMEKLSVQQQMLELHRREEDLANRKTASAQRTAFFEEERQRRVAERELLAQAMKALEDEQRAVESALKKFDVKRQQLGNEAQQTTAAVEDAQLKEVLAEQECHIVVATQNKKRAELENLKRTLAEVTTKWSAIEERQEVLRAQLKESEATVGDVAQETQMQEQVLRQYEQELRVWMQAEERGRNALQQVLQSQRTDCDKTDHISIDLQRARKALRASQEKERELQKRMMELDDVATIMDEQVEQVSRKIAEEEQKRSENSFAVREAKRRVIEELEAELQHWQRQVRHTQSAVDSAQNELRAHRRDMEAVDAVMKQMQDETKETQFEIAALAKEHQELGAKRRDVQDVHEALYWRLQEMERREAMAKDQLIDGLVEQEAMRAEGRLVEAQLVAGKEGKLIELHAHEDDVSRMRRTLQSHLAQRQTLESRHKDIMRIIQNRMDKLHDETLANTVPEGGKLPLAPVVDDMSSEELQARQMLLRAAERDRYLQYGNSLDAQLVKVEKDLRTLEQGLLLLRGSLQGDHRRLITGSPMSELEQEEEAILREIQEQYLEEVQATTAELESEVLSWEVECATRDAQLQQAKKQFQDAQKVCMSMLEKRDEVRGQLRQLERLQHEQLVDLDMGAAGLQRAQRLTRYLVDKQRSVQSNAEGLARLHAQDESETLDRLVRQLQQTVAAKNVEEMYFAFRKACDRFGLSIPSAETKPLSPLPRSSISSKEAKQHQPQSLRCSSSSARGTGTSPTGNNNDDNNNDDNNNDDNNNNNTNNNATRLLKPTASTSLQVRSSSMTAGRKALSTTYYDPLQDLPSTHHRKATHALREAMKDLSLNPPASAKIGRTSSRLGVRK